MILCGENNHIEVTDHDVSHSSVDQAIIINQMKAQAGTEWSLVSCNTILQQ